MENQSCVRAELFALCPMSIIVSGQELDAFVVYKIESEEQLELASYVAAQTYMTTSGYDEGFITDDLECRLMPRDAKLISESEAYFLSNALNVRIVNSLNELNPDYDLIQEVMSEDNAESLSYVNSLLQIGRNEH